MSTLYRVAPRRQFTIVPNEVSDDPRLSLRAKGLLQVLLRRGEAGRPLDSASVAADVKEGRGAVQTAYRELVEARYVLRERSQRPDGRWQTTLTIYDEAQPVDNSQPELPLPAPEDANPQVTPKAGFRASVFRASVDRASVSRSLKTEDEVQDEVLDDDDDGAARRDVAPVDSLAGYPMVRALADALGRPLVWNLPGPQLAALNARIRDVGDVAPFVAYAASQDSGPGRSVGATALAYYSGWSRLRRAASGPHSPGTPPSPAADPPPWCGECDPEGALDPGARWIEVDGRAKRCPRCHPSVRSPSPF